MQQELPKISVITVCLNAAGILGKTVESVVTQCYPNLEYIVVDGGSTDGSTEIIKSFGSSIHCFVSERDNGIYDAMNKGIRKATGDLVCFLNAGDYYISQHVLSYIVSKMKLNEADVFYGRFIWEDDSRKDIVLSDHSFSQFDWDLKYSNFPHPATFYKRHLFDNIGAFDENYRILGDYEWNARALVSHRIKFQYIDIIVALFATNGMSNDVKNSERIDQETKQISSKYFQPSWLFSFVSKYAQSNFSKKVIAKVFSKRLNRTW